MPVCPLLDYNLPPRSIVKQQHVYLAFHIPEGSETYIEVNKADVYKRVASQTSCDT